MRMRKKLLASSIIAVLFPAILLLGASCRGGGSEPTPPVTVEGGQISGVFEKGGDKAGKVAVYKGVPYAAAPVGTLRWKPPHPVEPWEGIMEANAYGPSCSQDDTEGGDFFTQMVEGQGMSRVRKTIFKLAVGLSYSPGEQSEDCLYLNIRTPVDENSDGAGGKPVMVWIHGGGHQNGSGSDNFYQSNEMALRGVVLVTINYRLGPLGYFAHPALSAESENGVSGNYGTLDQIAALRWVRDNIAAFGGDPSNVTIFGESAGGESVADMMASPLARGLFHRAIMQSASTGETLVHLKRPVLGRMAAEEAGRVFGEKTCGDDDLDDPIKALRAMPPEELFAAFREFSEFQTYSYPIVDGYVLPKSVVGTFMDGEQAPVPLMAGSNADEGTLLFDFGKDPLGIAASGPKTLEDYEQYVADVFGDDADEVLGLYPATDDAGVEKAVTDIYCDGRFGAKARYFASRTADLKLPAYLYFFTRVPPSPHQTIGAFHGVEIAFVFEKTVPLFLNNEYDEALSRTMADYWTQFAKTGNPNAEGLPEWPAYSDEDRRQMVLGPETGAAPVERAAKCDIMERHMVGVVEQLRGG
jgi:para-nitrobenzyl esterase